MNTKTVISAKDLSLTFQTNDGQVQALKDVSLDINQGDFVSFIGPSGCGKTTFLNCVSSLDEFTAGEVLVDGQPLSEMSDRERTDMRKNHLGFVFQSFNLIPVLSAVENVELPLILKGKSSKDARVIALDALEAVELKEWSGHLPAELSGGQQQRVTIARAFAHQPALILADEPTGNLDTTTSDSVMELLVNLNRKKGITFVIVTHEEEIARQCTRLVTIQDGLITSDEKIERTGDFEEE